METTEISEAVVRGGPVVIRVRVDLPDGYAFSPDADSGIAIRCGQRTFPAALRSGVAETVIDLDSDQMLRIETVAYYCGERGGACLCHRVVAMLAWFASSLGARAKLTCACIPSLGDAIPSATGLSIGRTDRTCRSAPPSSNRHGFARSQLASNASKTAPMRSISSSGIPKPHDVLTDLQSLAGDDWVSEDIQALKSYVSILQLGVSEDAGNVGTTIQEHSLARQAGSDPHEGDRHVRSDFLRRVGSTGDPPAHGLDRGGGLGKGDKVALLSENRWEWAVSDFAMMTAGIVSVPIYPTLPAEQIRYLLDHSESKAVLCSTAEQLGKIQEIRDQLPALNLCCGL